MSEKNLDSARGVVPDGVRVYAVGDIHGRLDLAREIATRIADDNAKRAPLEAHLIFLGDYVDRGPDSKGVIDYLLAELPDDFKIRFLKGNHEQFLLDFAAGATSMGWLRNGGDAALVSYGVDRAVVRSALAGEWSAFRAAQGQFRSLLPQKHADFFAQLDTHIHLGGYFFVHAGVRPGVPLHLQDEDDMLWIREEFLLSKDDFGAVVVHGHTPVRTPENYANRIGIDTYAFVTGHLTAVGLQGSERWFLST